MSFICPAIDFSINGQCTENRLRSQRTTTPHKIKVNNSKLMDLVIRIELTRANFNATILKFSEEFDHPFRMFLYLETCFLRVTVSLLCRLQAVSQIRVPIYQYLISEGRRNCSPLWPAQYRNHVSQETCNQINKREKIDVRISLKNLESCH